MVQFNIRMKLNIVLNNGSSLIEILEDVPVVISGCVCGKAHFCITN